MLIRYFNVQPFIATLAMMFLGRGLASLLSTKPERLGDGLADPLDRRRRSRSSTARR